MRERKKYFEPQVLKIEDTDEENYIHTIEDYEEDCDNDDDYTETRVKDLRKIRKKEAHCENKNNNDRVYSASSVFSSQSLIENERIECSRLTTGDTGYTSNLDTSLSSMTSLTNLKESLALSSLQSIQKPVIITGSQGVVNTSKTQVNSLKQLKNNISPLSNIKYVKNT